MKKLPKSFTIAGQIWINRYLLNLWFTFWISLYIYTWRLINYKYSRKLRSTELKSSLYLILKNDLQFLFKTSFFAQRRKYIKLTKKEKHLIFFFNLNYRYSTLVSNIYYTLINIYMNWYRNHLMYTGSSCNNVNIYNTFIMNMNIKENIKVSIKCTIF